jgi:hypothetical protein
VFAIALPAAACGGSDDFSEGTVLPFELVQASELVFEIDPLDPGRGISRVTTTEPMICSIDGARPSRSGVRTTPGPVRHQRIH